MINREMRKANLITYAPGVDEYGQPRKGEQSKRDIELTFRIYSHSPVEDIRFNEVTHTGLTADKTITDTNAIELEGKTYNIKFVNPEGRFAQLFMVGA